MAEEEPIIGRLQVCFSPQEKYGLYGDLVSARKDVTQTDYHRILRELIEKERPFLMRVNSEKQVIVPLDLLQHCVISLELLPLTPETQPGL